MGKNIGIGNKKSDGQCKQDVTSSRTQRYLAAFVGDGSLRIAAALALLIRPVFSMLHFRCRASGAKHNREKLWHKFNTTLFRQGTAFKWIIIMTEHCSWRGIVEQRKSLFTPDSWTKKTSFTELWVGSLKSVPVGISFGVGIVRAGVNGRASVLTLLLLLKLPLGRFTGRSRIKQPENSIKNTMRGRQHQ